MEQELGCILLELILTKKSLVFLTLSMKYFKQTTKNTLMIKISTRLLGLEFKSDNIIKLKAVKVIVKRVLPNDK